MDVISAASDKEKHPMQNPLQMDSYHRHGAEVWVPCSADSRHEHTSLFPCSTPAKSQTDDNAQKHRDSSSLDPFTRHGLCSHWPHLVVGAVSAGRSLARVLLEAPVAFKQRVRLDTPLSFHAEDLCQPRKQSTVISVHNIDKCVDLLENHFVPHQTKLNPKDSKIMQAVLV